jgi:hypothetical protein
LFRAWAPAARFSWFGLLKFACSSPRLSAWCEPGRTQDRCPQPSRLTSRGLDRSVAATYRILSQSKKE